MLNFDNFSFVSGADILFSKLSNIFLSYEVNILSFSGGPQGEQQEQAPLRWPQNPQENQPDQQLKQTCQEKRLQRALMTEYIPCKSLFHAVQKHIHIVSRLSSF